MLSHADLLDARLGEFPPAPPRPAAAAPAAAASGEEAGAGN